MTGSSPTFPAIEPPDEQTAAAALARQDTLTKPPGALGRLEQLSVWVASCQGSCPPRQFQRPRVVVITASSPRASRRSRPR